MNTQTIETDKIIAEVSKQIKSLKNDNNHTITIWVEDDYIQLYIRNNCGKLYMDVYNAHISLKNFDEEAQYAERIENTIYGFSNIINYIKVANVQMLEKGDLYHNKTDLAIDFKIF